MYEIIKKQIYLIKMKPFSKRTCKTYEQELQMLFTKDWTSGTTTATKLAPSHLLRTSLEMGFTLLSTYQFPACFYSTFTIVSCIRVFCLHICKCTMHVQCPRRLEEGIGSPEIGVRGSCEHMGAGN